jgi:hypothetical protein
VPKRNRRIFLWFAWSVGFVIVLILALPALGSLYMAQRLKKFVRIEAIYPGCPESEGDRSSSRCRCEFIFDGVTDPAAVSFSGEGLRHSYDSQDHAFQVSGTGTIATGISTIEIKENRIVINSTEIPADRPATFHVLIKRDGRLTGSRWDLSW